ncbi:hypothetical protein [Teredinibacter haidensis]|uniref:hypothetical protein n=1 Tax=Teredinibacter haidensis TaxID=2731755 RepID=UPI000948A52C|nr:hypothetical protein [Teredinibacter haidensis]
MNSDTPENSIPSKEALIQELEELKSSLLDEVPHYQKEKRVEQSTSLLADINEEYHDGEEATLKTDSIGEEEQAGKAEDFSAKAAAEKTHYGTGEPPTLAEGNFTPEIQEHQTTSNTVEASDISAESLPGQQPLFEEDLAASNIKNSKNNTPKTVLPEAKGENPFLPTHIRERLSENKNAIFEELTHVGETLAKHGFGSNSDKAAPLLSEAELLQEAANSELIDELVAKYLPTIEKELRTKLREQLLNK